MKKPEPKPMSKEEKDRRKLLDFLKNRTGNIREGLKVQFFGAEDSIKEDLIYTLIKAIDQVGDIHHSLLLDDYAPGEILKGLREGGGAP